MSEIGDTKKWCEQITNPPLMPEEWKEIMVGSNSKRNKLMDILTTINDDIKKNEKILRPDPHDIFAFCKYTTLNNIRVVIIGQDPYPNDHAMGLCFSSRNSVMPASFRMIHKALVKSGYSSEDEKTADLRGWAYQGVLLINTSFTTFNEEKKTHSDLWEPYFDSILARLAKFFDRRAGLYSVSWLLWGKDAQSKESIITDNTSFGKNIVMKWSHPSTISSCNTNKDDPMNFAKCDHFKRVTEITKAEWGIPLYWDSLSRKIECFTDGSANPNVASPEAKAGYGVIFTQGPLRGLTIAGRCDNTSIDEEGKCRYTTNIRAEGEALVRAMRAVIDLPDDIWDEFEIVFDCEHWINTLRSFIPTWLEKRSKFSEHKNSDIITEMWDLYMALKDRGKVTLRHVRSHKKAPKDKESREYKLWLYNNYVDHVGKHAREHLTFEESPVYSFNYYQKYMRDDPEIVLDTY
jgi:uracil-DNA glycosylase